MSHEPLPHLAWVLGVFGATLAVGYLCYLGVERPLLNVFRKPRRQGKPVPVVELPEGGGQRQAA